MLNISICYIYIIISNLGLWTWSTPSNTGGCDIVNYIIIVTQFNGSDPWNITTTDNSYNVT